MKTIQTSFLTFFCTAFFLYACKSDKKEETPAEYLSLANIKPEIKPGDDFFMFANGKWVDTAKIPPTESRIGAFMDMFDKAKANIKTILEEVSKSEHAKGSIEQQVGDLYLSGLDSVAVEKRGYEPVKPDLQQIDSIRDPQGLLKFAASQQVLNKNVLVGEYVGPDEKNSSVNIAVFVQAGLGLPDRDYYFKKDAATLAIVDAYKTYLAKLLSLSGTDSTTAAKNATAVFELEKQLATAHRTNVELRDPQSNYNKMAVADLDKKMPVLGWKNLLIEMKIKTDSLNLAQPAYYAKLNDLLMKAPLETWKLYLKVHVLDNAAPYLSSDFVNAEFDFYNKALRGQQKIKERWERIYAIVDINLGEALGQLYVKKYFNEDAKKRMLELVNNLQKAFETRINGLDWMSDSTKNKAKEKLNSFSKKIGFPDKWRDYSKVDINKSTYFENILSAGKNEYNRQINKIDKPVDKAEWEMTPPTINAYYNPPFNEIVFPAGILQSPMFNLNADDAVNYGGIGMVIGHEMTHGFDDQGAQYDKEGNLKNWWSKEDNDKFKAKGTLVADLYDTFLVVDSLHVNGRLTLGENMADIGGVAIAYDAFKLTKQGKDTAKIDGYTPDQRFFMAFAQSWKLKQKVEAQRRQVNTDPHSPANFRVWGPLMNFTPFYTAFNVKEGEKMYRKEADRIKIW